MCACGAQAEKLRSKAQRPEQARSSQQYSRYLYYLGRIRAIQLEYTDAKDCLQQAARKVRPALHVCAIYAYGQVHRSHTPLTEASLTAFLTRPSPNSSTLVGV